MSLEKPELAIRRKTTGPTPLMLEHDSILHLSWVTFQLKPRVSRSSSVSMRPMHPREIVLVELLPRQYSLV
jgi:hypothetical protein